jgi:predicted nucleotide-binding protein
MQKSKRYPQTKFNALIVRQAVEACRSLAQDEQEDIVTCSVARGNESWSFDSIDEFLTDYSDRSVSGATLQLIWHKENVSFYYNLWDVTTVSIKSNARANIQAVFSIFEECPNDQKVVALHKPKVSIFIGHGRNDQWLKLKSHLQDQHKLEVQAYETGARAGHTIRDILDDMSKTSSFALLVLTGEDKVEDGLRARQNVIHECGLFQGRLGFDRAIMLVEDGVELGSNFDGIQQLRFEKGRIPEVFGDVLATIKREFGPI